MSPSSPPRQAIPHPAYPLAQFPQHSAASITLFNLLASHRVHLQVELAGQPAALRLGATAPPFTAARNITLMLGNQRVWLTLPQESLAQLCASWLTNEPFHRLPILLRHSLLSVALEPLLAALSQILGGTGRVAVNDDSVPDSDLQQVGLWQGDSAFGALQLAPDTAASLTAALQTRPESGNDPLRWPTLPIALTLVMAEMRLSGIELMGLEPGDVVLLPVSSQNQPLTLCHGEHRLASATLDRDQVTLSPLPETRMSDNDDISQDQPLGAGLNATDLEVRLQFDLGDTTLSLADLQQLESGYTFTLDRSQPDIVRLRVGSQVIGHGELVQVDERLGVRVTTLFPRSDSGPDPVRTEAAPADLPSGGDASPAIDRDE